MRPVLLCVLCLVSLFAAGCSVKRAPVADGGHAPGAFVLPGGGPLSDAALAGRAARADYVLVGESHDRAEDHKAQARLLRLLAGRGQRVALGLEMLPRDRFDEALRDFAAGRRSLDALPAALDWERSWGYDFSLYQPIFAAALDSGVPIYGLNIEHELRRAVSRKGLEGLSAQERSRLPERIIPPLPEQRDKLTAFFLAHGSMMRRAPHAGPSAGSGAGPLVAPVAMPGIRDGREVSVILPVSLRAAFERFLLIQSLWDSTMAEQAAAVLARERRAAPGAGPLVILAGGGHVEYGYGIAHRLALLDPGAVIFSVMPFSGPVPGANLADAFYYSPAPEPSGFGLTFSREEGSVRILAVRPASRAEKAGLLPGDAVLAAGGATVNGPMDLHSAAMAAKRQSKALALRVDRDGSILDLTLE